jgi:septal ring factor EnvC (AmiA/AmiB activator)
MDGSKRLLWASGAMGIISIIALIALFVQITALRTDLDEFRARVDDSMRKVTITFEEEQKLVDGLRSDVGKNVISINALSQDLGKLQSDFTKLKVSLAEAAAKSINKEIIDAATNQATTEAARELASTSSGKFIEQLAKALASNYRMELTGPPGKDADEERIATFLLARPEFLDAVSVSIVQQGKNK